MFCRMVFRQLKLEAPTQTEEEIYLFLRLESEIRCLMYASLVESRMYV
jgi:hypothetical protein